MLTVHHNDKHQLYFSIPDSIFGRDLYFMSKVIATSNTREVVAGQVNNAPFLFRFSKDKLNVYMITPDVYQSVAPWDVEMGLSFAENSLPEVIKAFPIVATEGGKVLIDVTDFFSGDETLISPIQKVSGPMASMVMQGTLDKKASSVIEAKSYPINVEVVSYLTYRLKPYDDPYTLKMQRSILLLPKEPMKPRFQDNRVGFFSSGRNLFTSQSDKMETYRMAHRWNLQPSDTAAYFQGKLVEPVKPIIFYVDPAFPPKWREIIKQGIEDWNIAFEEAGFKNAIIAKDYPEDDPDFDPNDVRYNTFRYATTSIQNAMGPSYVDPRSGEIISAQVIWYHNVLSLVHNWRFVQTAAVDPRVRTHVFAKDLMRESLRYVASHEVGHTVGLMHNMGASHSFTIDQLRDPEFTAEYGTTPSIMDYARNNFVAQPGDLERGVKLTPPIMGVYDKAAIKWGYTVLPGNLSPSREKKILDKMLEDNYKDPKLRFGAQQFPFTIDPTAQTEDLSNDHFTASDLSISNLKIIAKNIDRWLLQSGKNYRDIREMYLELVNQYYRHLGHIKPYIGGITFYEARQGDQENSVAYVERNLQKKAVKWIGNELFTFESWLFPNRLMALIGDGRTNIQKNIIANTVNYFFDLRTLQRIHDFSLSGAPDAYSLAEYCEDVRQALFAGSEKSAAITENQKLVEQLAIENMLMSCNPDSKDKNKKTFAFESAELSKSTRPICCYDYVRMNEHHSEDTETFSRFTSPYGTLQPEIAAPYWHAALEKILTVYKRNASAASEENEAYYKYYVSRIQQLFEEK